MKRITAILLAVLFCLSLCACEITIHPPFGPDVENIPGNNNVQNDQPQGSHISDHPWMKYLYGQWRFSSDFGIGGEDIDTVTIHNDGRLIYAYNDGTSVTYTWWVNETLSNDTRLVIDYYSKNGFPDADNRMGIVLGRNGHGAITFDVCTYLSDTDFYCDAGGFYNTAYYKEIEINNETISEYFEFRNMYEMHTNSFGEVIGHTLHRYFALKENYYPLSYPEHVAVEYRWKIGTVDCTVDFENQMYVISSDPQNVQECHNLEGRDTLYDMLTYLNYYYDEDSGSFQDYIFDLEIIRSQGVYKILEIPQ